MSTDFQDRPGTRVRIDFPTAPAPKRGRVVSIFIWLSKLIYALTAGMFCVGVASFAPVGGPPIARFIPADSVALVHVHCGAELHRTLMSSPAFNDLLNDSDTAEYVASLRRESTGVDGGRPASKSVPLLRAEIASAWSTLVAMPWNVAEWLIPPNAEGAYPFVGGECALALTSAAQKDTQRFKPTLLFFTRVSGSRGHLARMAVPFIKPDKQYQVFNLGGDLICVGLNGARPALEAHVLSKLAASAPFGENVLLRAACDARAFTGPEQKNAVPTSPNEEILAWLADEGVPGAVLKAMARPPGLSEMLHWNDPPEFVRLELCASVGGGVTLAGRIDGRAPQLDEFIKTEPQPATGSEFSSADVMAEAVLPVDLRALFLRYVASGMKPSKDATTLTRGQRRWVARFHALDASEVDLERDFWPATGPLARLTIHEAKKAESLTQMGTIRLWAPFKPLGGQSFFAAKELARARWDYLFDDGVKAPVKPPYVRRFPLAVAAEERYVLATGNIAAPAWSLGKDGLRATSEAGSLALLNGPAESVFPAPLKSTDAYLLKFDGPRLAATAEGLATVAYDDLEEELGSPRLFTERYPHRDLHIRLAAKWTRLLGSFDLKLKPEKNGARMELNWKPAGMAGPVNPQKEKSKGPDNNQTDDNDAPPPPPAN